MSFKSVENSLSDGLLKYVQHKHHMRGTLIQLIPQPPIKLLDNTGKNTKLPQFLPAWKSAPPQKRIRETTGSGESGLDITGANSLLNTLDLDSTTTDSNDQPSELQ